MNYWEEIKTDGIDHIRTTGYVVRLGTTKYLRGMGTLAFSTLKDFIFNDFFMEEFNKKHHTEFFKLAVSKNIESLLRNNRIKIEEYEVFAWWNKFWDEDKIKHLVSVLSMYYGRTDFVTYEIVHNDIPKANTQFDISMKNGYRDGLD